jgi:hypothetical protein
MIELLGWSGGMGARAIGGSGAGSRSRVRIRRGAFGGAFLVATYLIVGAGASAAAQSLFPLGDKIEVQRLSDEPIPLKSIGEIPQRPALFLELGDLFLGTGKLGAGFEVPILGAIWQPRLWSYFIYRTTLQSFESGRGASERETEWANRLDLYANLQLTGTEKIFLGLRPLDENEPGRFSRYSFDGSNDAWSNELNLDIETLFFEGDLGSLLPKLDPVGMKPLDYGFTVGRQPITFQEGILINDTVDALGFIRNNIVFPGTSNLRISGMWAWDRLDRNDVRDGSDPQMFALFSAADLPLSTVNLDMAYVEDDLDNGDSLNIGLSSIQRMGPLSTAFRINGSIAFDEDVPGVAADGALLSGEFSWHAPSSDDIVYINPFWGIENYTQAGREVVVGGPLASLGVLFASPNLSTYGAEIDPFTDDVAGAAIGYQAFWDNKRRNLVLEIAGRKDTGGKGFDSLGLGFQLQQALGQHYQVQLEGYYALQEDRTDSSGARLELLVVY